MRLSSLDKYIKDKVQGYKPTYQEDLWKGIAEKLPPARVPNGSGSWMLPIAALVVLAILVPFTIKFYNLTGSNQEATLKNADSNISQKPLRSPKNSIGPLAHSYSPEPSRIASKDNVVLAIPTTEPNADGLSKSYLSANTNSYIRNNGRKVVSGSGYPQNGQAMASASNQNSTSKDALKKLSMTNIYPYNSLVGYHESNDITKKGETRYPHRKSRHPLDNERWENWQSIYYPFWDNPAYTGSEGKLSIAADYRADNTIETTAPHNTRNTYFNSGADYYSHSLGLGVGVFMLSELSKYSLLNTYGLAISKEIVQIGSTSIKVGVSGTSINNNLFFNLLDYSDQINPKFGFINATSEKDIAGTTHAFGLNGGLWLSNPHVMAGLDATNINQPKPSLSSDVSALPRQWRATLGYRFAVCSDFQFMPMTIITRENQVNQANAMLTVVYKNKYMLSFAYQNIDPVSGLGNAYVYGAVSIAKKLRLFASYGKDMELEQTGIDETFVHTGFKYEIIR